MAHRASCTSRLDLSFVAVWSWRCSPRIWALRSHGSSFHRGVLSSTSTCFGRPSPGRIRGQSTNVRRVMGDAQSLAQRVENDKLGMNSMVYHHVPLADCRTQMRLFKSILQPGRLAIQTCSKSRSKCFAAGSKAPTYQALSYTWGSVDGAQTILTNGKPFEVRLNLHDFLHVCSKAATNNKAKAYPATLVNTWIWCD
jgi:hypothetical protein